MRSLFWSASAAEQQAGSNSQVGAKWNEEQLRQAVAPARVGRTLTPRVWPGNARVAVCLSFDVDNESYLLARGETSPTTLSAGGLRRRNRPRAHPSDARSASGARLVLHSRGERSSSSENDSSHSRKWPARDRRARLDPRIIAGHRKRRRRGAAPDPGDRISDEGVWQAPGRLPRAVVGVQSLHAGPDPQTWIPVRQQPDGNGRTLRAHLERATYGARRTGDRLDVDRDAIPGSQRHDAVPRGAVPALSRGVRRCIRARRRCSY